MDTCLRKYDGKSVCSCANVNLVAPAKAGAHCAAKLTLAAASRGRKCRYFYVSEVNFCLHKDDEKCCASASRRQVAIRLRRKAKMTWGNELRFVH